MYFQSVGCVLFVPMALLLLEIFPLAAGGLIPVLATKQEVIPVEMQTAVKTLGLTK